MLARSNHVFEGYWNQPEETAKAIDDGWFHTGDGGYREDAYVVISDRKKDVIITGGENVSSIEVEDCLFQHPAVAEVAVIGVPDEKWGETIKALVVLRPGASRHRARSHRALPRPHGALQVPDLGRAARRADAHGDRASCRSSSCASRTGPAVRVGLIRWGAPIWPPIPPGARRAPAKPRRSSIPGARRAPAEPRRSSIAGAPNSCPPPGPTSTRAAGTQLDIVIVSGDAYVDHPAFGPVLIARFLEGRGFKVGIIAQPDWRSAEPFRALGQAAPVLRHLRRQPRLDAQPAHRAEEEPLGGPVHPRRPHRLPPQSRDHRLRPALPRGLPRRADRARRHRGLAAADRPLRLLDRHGAPLDPARRQGRPARLRHGRAAGLGGRRPPEPRRAHRARSATCAAPRS